MLLFGTKQGVKIMKLKINDNYIITSDTHCYILNKILFNKKKQMKNIYNQLVFINHLMI